MSFTRSGTPAPSFGYPIGTGTFTDVNASNAVFTSNVYSSFIRGDGGFLSNVNSSVPGTLPNLVVSNSLTTTNVFATRANVGTLNVVSVSNLNSLALTTANVGTLNVGSISNLNSLNLTTLNVTSVVSASPISFRNRVINGDFFTDQRNAGAATTPSVDPTRTIDRWKVNIVGSGRCQVGQNLGAIASPTGFTSYYGMKVTTTSTVGASDYFFFSQVIEGINAVDFAWGTAAARTVTLGFWVYSSLTGTMGGFVRNAGSTAGNYSRSYPFTFSVSSASTWEYKTVVVPGDTTGQWLTGQTDGIEFGFELWNGTTYQSTPNAWAAGNFTGPSGGTANFAGTLNSYFYVTGVQVEPGPVGTPFERRHINFELTACQRYYEVTVARVGGYTTNGAYIRGSVYFNTKKRAAPSPTFTVVSTLETSNCGSLNFDNSNYDGSSTRYLVPVTATGDAYGQWKVSVDCEF